MKKLASTIAAAILIWSTVNPSQAQTLDELWKKKKIEDDRTAERLVAYDSPLNSCLYRYGMEMVARFQPPPSKIKDSLRNVCKDRIQEVLHPPKLPNPDNSINMEDNTEELKARKKTVDFMLADFLKRYASAYQAATGR